MVSTDAADGTIRQDPNTNSSPDELASDTLEPRLAAQREAKAAANWHHPINVIEQNDTHGWTVASTRVGRSGKTHPAPERSALRTPEHTGR